MNPDSRRPLRIAMWSGPRNISTAMMRAFENRPDCFVSDEPLYAAWLEMTGADHPMRDQVVAAMETDWRRVTEALTGPVPGRQPLWYQKQMTHHLLPEMMQRDWLSKLVHVFLIRDPAAVVASYLNKRDSVSPEDIGVPQQWQLFEFVRDFSGQSPPVIDSGEFLADPAAHLRALCRYLEIDFVPDMLAWPAGPRDSDGVWAPHWYQSVWQSTGFAEPCPAAPGPTGRAAEVVEACRPIYQRLYRQRLTVG
ncbi:MAG: hypothetical protein RQ741_13080 [Wenzhouxiangellaceae bacterium]|nr:hypothetical protein [Wenzhouxiangellaceae bacterium]